MGSESSESTQATFSALVVRTKPLVLAVTMRWEQLRSLTDRGYLVLDRPVDSEHVIALKAHLRRAEPVLPLTLGLRSGVRISGNGPSVSLALGDDTIAVVIDGQHRLAAMLGLAPRPGLIEESPDLLKESVLVELIVEPDKAVLDQYFVDAQRTARLPEARLAAYDQRDPVNATVGVLMRDSWLAGWIDVDSATLSRGSRSLFLLSNLRTMVQAMTPMEGIPSAGEGRDRFETKILGYVNRLADTMEPWATINKSAPLSLKSRDLASLRDQFLNMRTTGLAVLGQLFALIEANVDPSQSVECWDAVAALDWTASSADWGMLHPPTSGAKRQIAIGHRELALAVHEAAKRASILY